MNTEKMTVHRALAELKTIDSRIEAQIMKADFCCANKHSNKKIKGDTIAAYEDAARAAYKSISTLISRRNALKKAVVLSNARTIVTIGGIDYTVAEAIEMKNHGIDNQRNLMDVMRHQFRSASNEIDRRNGDELERKATEYALGMYGSKDAKNIGEEAEAAKKTYIENNTYDLIDPLKIRERIDELEEKTSTFMADVDAALSVSNAITEIEFTYEVM